MKWKSYAGSVEITPGRLIIVLLGVALLVHPNVVLALEGMALSSDHSNWPDPGVLKLTRLPSADTIDLVPGNVSTAAFSPEGRRIAFVKNEVEIYAMDLDGGNQRLLCSSIGVKSISWRVPNAIHFVQNQGAEPGGENSIWKVELGSNQKSKLHTTDSDGPIWSLSVSSDGQRGAFVKKKPGFKAFMLNLANGQEREAGEGCGANISPDGRLVSNLISGHKQINIVEFWNESNIVKSINIDDHHPGEEWDDPRWSVNSNEHIAYTLESSNDIVVLNISSGEKATAISGSGARTLWAWDFFFGEPEPDGAADGGVSDSRVDSGVEPDSTTRPSISLLSPNGGEVWLIGQTQHIEWNTNLVSDVTISFSIDNGDTWNKIADTVDTLSPDWGHYPWVVPNQPSKDCLVHIQDYLSAGISDISDQTFEISSGGNVKGSGCNCRASDPGPLGILPIFLFLLALFLRRPCRKTQRAANR